MDDLDFDSLSKKHKNTNVSKQTLLKDQSNKLISYHTTKASFNLSGDYSTCYELKPIDSLQYTDQWCKLFQNTQRSSKTEHRSTPIHIPQNLVGFFTIFNSIKHITLICICVLSILQTGSGKPLTQAEQKYRKLQTDTVKYLAQFGYLKGPSRETQNLMSHEDLTRAIKALQKAGGITQTGVPDRRTEKLMKRPRCGNSDDFVDDLDDDMIRGGSYLKIRKKRFTLATSKWQRTNLTFRFVNYTPDIPQDATRRVIVAALRVWSDATPLSFHEVRTKDADIMIQFASKYHSDGYPFDGKGMVLAHAFFPGKSRGGDTHFDDDENWSDTSTGGVDLFMVAAHEFGHALGLAHSGDPSALMYPWYMGVDGEFTLPDDDYRGIVQLYGSGEREEKLPEKGKVNLIPIDKLPVAGEDPRYDVYDNEPDINDDVIPDPCSTSFDAITIYRDELFVFVGKWFWRMDRSRKPGAAIAIHQFWYDLPESFKKVDAIFERHDHKLVIISGNRYWLYYGNNLIKGFPTAGKPLTDFNIPESVKKIDTAFVWGYNMRSYLVSGHMYWKMNENNTFVEYDYPRDMRMWKGVPIPLDAAYKDWSNRTFFFKDNYFWEFYDLKMQTRKKGYPKMTKHNWLKCEKEKEIDNIKDKSVRKMNQNLASRKTDKQIHDDADKSTEKYRNSASRHIIQNSISILIVLFSLLDAQNNLNSDS